MRDFPHSSKIQKRQRLGQQLKEEILGGKYTFGEQLPPVAKLAEVLGGNYVTIIKVLHDLEQEGFVECRNGVGCFIKYLPADKAALGKKVQLIVNKATYSKGQEDVLKVIEMAREQFTARGWEFEVCPVSLTNHELQRAINNPDAYSVIYGIQPYLSKVDANFAYVRNRIVLIGEFANQPGIATVIADEYYMMRLAIEHLRAHGYFNTALVLCSMHSSVEQIFAEAWCGMNLHYGKSLQWCQEHCIYLAMDSLNKYAQSIQDIVPGKFRPLHDNGLLDSVDSIIGPGGFWTTQVGDSLKSMGYRIPEDIALISIGGENSWTQEYAPRITCLNPPLEEHVAFSVEILENRFSGHGEFAVQYCVTPTLVERESTKSKTLKK